MRRAIGFGLLAVGIVLLILGISTADSLSSQFSEFFTGSPSDKAIWMLLLGVFALIAGGIMAALPGKARA